MNSLILVLAFVGFVATSTSNEANIHLYLHLSDDDGDSDYANTMPYAQCEMEPNPNQPTSLHHHGDGELTMKFHLTGFNVSDDFKDHNHGLQIHEYGDFEHDCDTIGELYHGEHVQGHVNPGDLGDIHDDDHGNVEDTRKFDWLTTGHTDGILGRSVAILPGDHTSHTAIIACCVIGRSHHH